MNESVASAYKPRKSSVIRKSSLKSPATQSAIAIKRANGDSKLKIAKDLGISPNTVTSVLALNDVDEKIAEYRKGAMALVPLAISAVEKDLQVPGNGNLGLRVLESTGIVGENAIESARLNTIRQRSAINVLVQAGGTVELHNNAAEAGTDTKPQITQVIDSTHDK